MVDSDVYPLAHFVVCFHTWACSDLLSSKVHSHFTPISTSGTASASAVAQGFMYFFLVCCHSCEAIPVVFSVFQVFPMVSRLCYKQFSLSILVFTIVFPSVLAKTYPCYAKLCQAMPGSARLCQANPGYPRLTKANAS